ncbi:outer membrane beta-barrel family protein [Arenibacter algicola]|uniref:Outer membrane protein beta-barrel family protein n=1 Tax=Arenibacter algicola TaxID=616991 RepID=A0A221UUY6_9FLAO|nr:outer membrane beta-barrel family protein [Arenibacter algicola]ASO05122.1 outer membrane protein beta-barrel family protein [Arenibacter algicola]|tara:strand:+ start:36403 stop:38775 length:2373 start_codon:yes stop_codon:yes gene_type:complete
MKKISVQILIACSFLLYGPVAMAQVTIKGTVVEESSGQPIAYATVMVGDNETKKPLDGTTTMDDGSFSLETDATDYYIEVSFLGFRTKTFGPPPTQGKTIDLGKVALSEDAEQLQEVVVQGEVSRTEFKLDKRVFNVGKDLSTTGASALEVLNNVPSVNVNIEGRISLRGSQGVQILINGKPSIIASDEGNALGTITADMIEKIEVMTNPSAKYDAEGTSGIINIVLKKEERKGLNGSISVNTGAPDSHSVGVSLNRRTENFNLFTQLGVGLRDMPNDLETRNVDLINNTTILSNGTEYRNETYYNFVLGTDYHINDNNVLTLSGNFAMEMEDQPSNTSFVALDSNNAISSEWERTEVTDAKNPKFQYELQYKKDFENHEDHTLLFSGLGNFFGKDQSSEFLNTTISGDDNDSRQQTRTDFKEAIFTFKLDYTNPITDELTLETGAQYVMNDVSNDYEVNNFTNGAFVNDPGLTNIFEFDQKVLGLYGTGSYEGKKWGIKGGLRLEQTDQNTLLVTTSSANEQNYGNFFPSLHSSYKFSDKVSLQAGYSKRIYRPRMWDLNPFFNIRNNFSVRQGNPDLQPEFTDSYEITSIYILGPASINFGVYHRYTTDVIERITTFENNVSTTKPENIGTNRATGIEFNAKYSPAKWLTLNGDFNYNQFKRDGNFESTVFDFSNDQWTSKLMSKIKLPSDFDLEMTGNYQSSYQTVQSDVSDMLFMDLGLRKNIMKGKAVLNLSVRDLFASRVDESQIAQASYEVYNRRQRGTFVALGFSYGFGKGEAMQYSGQRRR